MRALRAAERSAVEIVHNRKARPYLKRMIQIPGIKSRNLDIQRRRARRRWCRRWPGTLRRWCLLWRLRGRRRCIGIVEAPAHQIARILIEIDKTGIDGG